MKNKDEIVDNSKTEQITIAPVRWIAVAHGEEKTTDASKYYDFLDMIASELDVPRADVANALQPLILRRDAKRRES